MHPIDVGSSPWFALLAFQMNIYEGRYTVRNRPVYLIVVNNHVAIKEIRIALAQQLLSQWELRQMLVRWPTINNHTKAEYFANKAEKYTILWY